MIEARDLAVFRGERLVFSGVGFRLAPGGALLLTGPNGSGKSTLLRALAGLGRLAGGTLLWDGADALADLPAHAARLAWLGHQDAVKPGLGVAENLRLWAPPRSDPALVRTALATMGLDALAEFPARLLSAGQRRRLAIARLALDPLTLASRPLWLLDEPTPGLDDAAIARLGALLAAHRARGGMVIAATHQPLELPGAATLALRHSRPEPAP